MGSCIPHTTRLGFVTGALLVAGCSGPAAKTAPEGTRRGPPHTVDISQPSDTAPMRETIDRPVTASDPKATAATPKRSLGTLPQGIGIPIGSRAPDFTALDTSRKPVSLSDLVHRSKVLLFFYRGGW